MGHAARRFFDQAALYSAREFKPAWFTREEVEANAARSSLSSRCDLLETLRATMGT